MRSAGVGAALAAVFLFAGAAPANAEAEDPPAEVAWRVLDYMAVDYAGAVGPGRAIVDRGEYAEMVEFAGVVREYLIRLPPSATRAALLADADALRASIGRRDPPELVSERTRALAERVLRAYVTTVSPVLAPDLDRGRALYAAECSACHGAEGQGTGPAARGMNPPPIAFADAERASQRSVFALFQVITQGLNGTGMVSFRRLPAADRWALAYYVGQMSYSDAQAREGERLWRSSASVRARLDSLRDLSLAVPRSLAGQIGEAQANAVTAYLRRHPALAGAAPPPSDPPAAAAPRAAGASPVVWIGGLALLALVALGVVGFTASRRRR